MQQNPDFLRQAQVFLFVQWVFFNTLGWAIGIILLIFAVREITTDYGMFALFAFTLGIGQYIVLRRHLNRPKFLWVLLTCIGFVVGNIAAQTMTDAILPSIGGSINNIGVGLVFGGAIGIVLGACVGLIQLPLLPRRFAPRGYWVLANIVGWGLGLQLSALMPNISFLVTSLTAAILNACITGMWVMQLLNEEEATAA